MKEFRRLKKDVPGNKLIIPYQTRSSNYTIIALEFYHNTVYEFELTEDHAYYDQECYKTKSKSYYKPVYLTKDIIDKYFMDNKEMHNEEFNEKMDKLLK